MLERLKGPVRQAEDDDEETVKIIYCSRTHSQLIQFAQEMRRVLPVSSVPPDLDEKQDEKEGENETGEWIKHTPLASRKALCINPSVRSLSSATAINERCLEIQRPNVAAEHRCPYLPADNELKTSQFQDHLLARVSDIEDLPPLGTRIGICPYYATRTAMRAPATEVVTLPYPLLLQQSAREALNLSAKKSVIIIDEAHNLVDAIVNIHSVTVSLAQLRTALAQITTYAKRFKTRLRGRNRVYIAQLIRLVGCMVRCLEEVAAQTDRADGELKVQDVLGGGLGKGGADMINPHKLGVYLRESKLARKVDGYIEHTTAQAGGGMGAGRKGDGGMPVLFHVQSFLLPLMDPSDEGRLFYEKVSGDVQMKYLLLDPTSRFRELVEDARAVILAGGTMEPVRLPWPPPLFILSLVSLTPA